MSRRAEKFEGRDIMWYLSHPTELEQFLDGVIDDELTKGRIRTIYVKIKYGSASVRELANYYDLDEALIRDIANGKIFSELTKDLN